MNFNGFATMFVLLAVFSLAIIGGIAYIHYYYLPQIEAQSNVSPAMSTVSPSPTSTAPTVATQTTAGPKICAANDMSCFIVAAQNCSPAKVEWTQTINLFNIFDETSQVHLALKGLNSTGKCLFSDRTDGLDLKLTAQAEQREKAMGTTDAQIQQYLQTATAQAKQKSLGTTISCAMTTTNLVQMFTKWSKGQISTRDLSSGNCVATLPSGNRTTLYVGGFIPLTPSNQTAQQQTPSINTFGNTATPATVPPSGIGTMAASLYPNENFTANGIQFKVGTITATQLNMTVTDTAKDKSATVSLVVNQPVTVVGHDMMVTSITQINQGTINGQPIVVNQAKLTYK